VGALVKQMDFEIEEEDSSEFHNQWSKPAKGGFFGGGFGGGGGKGGEDVYDYDFGGGGGGEYEFSHYSSPPEKSKPVNNKKVTENGKASSTKKTATTTPTSTSQMSAMEKAQSMLNKYSGKATTAAKKPPAPTKDYFSSDFNEDDISIGSDDLSTSGVIESPRPAKAARPQLTKGPAKPVHQQLSRGFDLEDDDELVCDRFSSSRLTDLPQSDSAGSDGGGSGGGKLSTMPSVYDLGQKPPSTTITKSACALERSMDEDEYR
jgi:hypothetical protein